MFRVARPLMPSGLALAARYVVPARELAARADEVIE
jgi:hypothetical protein